MANMVKSSYTNATALAAALKLAKAANPYDADLVAKLERMAEVAARPSKKAEGPTKSQVQNLGYARRVAAFVWDAVESDPDMLISSKLVTTSAGVAEVASTQKAASVLAVAAANGWVTKRDVKGKPYWTVGEVDPR